MRGAQGDGEGDQYGPVPADAVPGDDERLSIARIRAGDQIAFRDLFLCYGSVLASFIMTYVHSREVAEDLVHDLFLAVWQGRDEWQPHGTIESYLFLAARNRAHNYLRHERVAQRWRERSAHELAAEGDEPGEDDRLEAAERRALVIRAIAELPERSRLVATLRWVDGLTYTEIAQRLGITVKGVEIALTRSFAAIRKRLTS